MKNTFPKKQKLIGNKNIETLLHNGEAFFVHPFKVVYLSKKTDNNENASIKYLIAVPKKRFKLATARNHIKRIIRDTIRLNQHQFIESIQKYPLEISIMLSYQHATIINFAEMQKPVLKVFHKISSNIESIQ